MSDERPLVSILVPTLNRRSWLEQCLDSVVPQLTEDCELLVGNNCSDDDTALLEKRYQHPRIRWINFTERLPMKHNWQRLVDRAQGTWFILLSDDDKLAPDAIDYLRAILLTTKSDIIFGSFCIDNYQLRYTSLMLNPDITFMNPRQFFRKYLVEKALAWCLAATAFRRHAVMKLGGFMMSRLDFCMDSDVFYRLIASGSYVTFSSHVLASYAQHSSSTCMKKAQTVLAENIHLSQIYLPFGEDDFQQRQKILQQYTVDFYAYYWSCLIRGSNGVYQRCLSTARAFFIVPWNPRKLFFLILTCCKLDRFYLTFKLKYILRRRLPSYPTHRYVAAHFFWNTDYPDNDLLSRLRFLSS